MAEIHVKVCENIYSDPPGEAGTRPLSSGSDMAFLLVYRSIGEAADTALCAVNPPRRGPLPERVP